MATSDPAVTEREREHARLSTHIATQGIVLLENRGCLPFDDTVRTLALFGNGARRTLKGGTGSGDVNVRSFVTVEQGLLKAGYNVVTTPWLDEFDAVVGKAKDAYYDEIRESSKQGALVGLLTMMRNPFREPDFRCLSGQELAQYPADTAIYVLSRSSGEGADRKPVEGDYDLNQQEIHDITLLSERYNRCVLLLNTGGVIDLSPIRDLPGLGAIMLISQGGSGIGDAVSAMLSGRVTPSGKLTATWARSYADYPFGDEFAANDGNIHDSYYKEGIYVGYRYFDTFCIEPAWPFGFGRSYTDFAIAVRTVALEENTVTVLATVTNIGKHFAGREIVQAYASAPDGELDKPYQALVSFGKTKTLLPGECQTLTLSFPLERLASYSERKAAWVLERGDYVLRCGSSSRDTEVAAVLTVPETVLTEQCRNLLRSEKVEACQPVRGACTPVRGACTPVRGACTPVPGACAEQYPDAVHLIVDVTGLPVVVHTYSGHVPEQTAPKQVPFDGVRAGQASAGELAAQLSAEELATLCVGATRISLTDFSVIGNFSNELPGAAGETTTLLGAYGIPHATMVDGPAGIRVNPKIYKKDGLYTKNPAEDPIFGLILPPEQAQVDLTGTVTQYQYCTALPIATMLAQTWDLALLEQAGRLVGAEMEELGVDLWLAPGMNIQRSPLCGRNFEYFSEDPLVSGLCAAAITKGVQHYPGKGATIKHLAANSQETNRNYNNSHVSERALREVYLKAFELCVKASHPLAAMTSVNLVNGVHTANDRDLLTAALRDEWGFDGVVMTDWGATSNLGRNHGQKYDCSSSALCIHAGNDLIMPGSQRDVDRILAALADGSLALGELQRCAENLLRLLSRIAS